MTKQCPECKRHLEHDNINFRFSCGFWRNKCRECQNKHKRKKYHLQKKRARQAIANVGSKSRTETIKEKYDMIFEMEERSGVLDPQTYINLVIGRESIMQSCLC